MTSAPRFSVVRELGRGGMGAVLLVADAERGEQVALKRAQQVSPEALARLKREFRVVERLAHPALVRLHELGEDDEGVYYTMEVVEGVDLATWCRGGRAPAGSGGRSTALGDTLASGEALTLDAAGAPPGASVQRTVEGEQGRWVE